MLSLCFLITEWPAGLELWISVKAQVLQSSACSSAGFMDVQRVLHPRGWLGTAGQPWMQELLLSLAVREVPSAVTA